jgi:hypothetical protein
MILRLVSFSLIFCALSLVGGCKDGQWKKTDRESDGRDGGTVVEPKKVSEADATAALSTTFEVDEKTGRVKQSLVLRLDYFPKTETSGTNLPACYGAFPATFQLGYYSCVGEPEKNQVLNAGHLFQDCYTNPRFNRVQPSSPIVLPGCSRGVFALHSFDPPMRIDAEQRESM